jgi:hypothetical protein
MANKDVILSWKQIRKAINSILDNFSLASMFIIIGIDLGISYGEWFAPYAIGLAVTAFLLTLFIENRILPWNGLAPDKKFGRVIALGALSALTILPGTAIATIILGAVGVVKLGRKL